MANTKKLTRPERKAAKRKARQALKKTFQGLTREQRAKFKESEHGLKKFLAEQSKAAPASA